MRGERSKHEKVVIIRNLFTPELFDKEVHLILEYQKDLREECGKCGTVRKVVVYDVSIILPVSHILYSLYLPFSNVKGKKTKNGVSLYLINNITYENRKMYRFSYQKSQRHPDGVAQINMADPDEADIVIQMMNGRFFGQRKLIAESWDGKTKYK